MNDYCSAAKYLPNFVTHTLHLLYLAFVKIPINIKIATQQNLVMKKSKNEYALLVSLFLRLNSKPSGNK